MNNLKEKRLIVILGGRFSSKIVFQILNTTNTITL